MRSHTRSSPSARGTTISRRPFASCGGGVALLASAPLMSMLLMFTLGACKQEAPAPQPGTDPTNTTYNLAPSAAAKAADSVLTNTSPDATSAPAAAAPAAPVPMPQGNTPGGQPSPTCVNGWSIPGRGGPLRGAVLDMMRVQRGERFVVEEMRYFIGPEDAEVVGPRGNVERWYVKAYTESEPRRRQRWLVRRAAVGSGVDALAPYESKGYGAATWRRPDAADESLSDPFERPCQGSAPGEKCMGLPREVLGCLSGT